MGTQSPDSTARSANEESVPHREMLGMRCTIVIFQGERTYCTSWNCAFKALNAIRKISCCFRDFVPLPRSIRL
jgi:hypothetical protein